VKLLTEWETTTTSEESTQRNFGIAGSVLYFIVGAFGVLQLVMIFLTAQDKKHLKESEKDKAKAVVFVIAFEISSQPSLCNLDLFF